MTNKLLITQQDGTPKSIVFADHGDDFDPAAANDLRDAVSANRTNVQISLTGVADGAARQSAKFDFGENWGQAYHARGAIEIAATPGAGSIIEILVAPSQSPTAANANAGGVSGVDAAYAGYAANLGESVLQLDHVGAFLCTSDDTPIVQIAEIGDFSPTERYGSLIFKNESGAAIHADDVECHIVFDPIVPEVQ